MQLGPITVTLPYSRTPRRRRAPLILLLLIAPSANAQNWPRFRGPNGTGLGDSADVPAPASEKDFAWKIDLPGGGHGSPVAWGDRVFLTAADETSGAWLVVCVNLSDGSQRWLRRFDGPTFKHHRFSALSASTPAVDARRVYVAHATPDAYTLLALDHDGHDLWTRDLGPFQAEHGGSPSPIVLDDLVIVPNQQDGASFILAVDAKTGEPRWTLDRKHDRADYGTPCVRTIDAGQRELIFASATHGITGVDPRNGHVNWELPGVFDKRVVSSPILAAGLVIGACGSGGGGNYVAAVRPPAGDAKPELVYTIDRSAPYVPTSLSLGDLLFLWGDNGIVSCVDARTGDVRWRERVEGRFFSSPVCAAGRLYNVSDEGELVTLAAKDTFELLARCPLGEPSRASPAVAQGRLLLRTFTHLICLGGDSSSVPRPLPVSNGF